MDKKRTLNEKSLMLRKEILKRREDDPLFNFEPHVKQKEFIDSILEKGIRQSWFIAANRCLTPYSPIETDCATRLPVELIDEQNFCVRSWRNDSRCNKKATALFLKGIEPAYRFHLDTGDFFECSLNHHILDCHGEYVSLYLLMSKQDDRHCKEIVLDYQDGYSSYSHQYDQLLPLVLDIYQEELLLTGDAPQYTRAGFLHEDEVEPILKRIRSYQELFRLSTLNDPDRLLALFDLLKDPFFLKHGQQLPYERLPSRRSGYGSIPLQYNHEFFQLSSLIPLFNNVSIIGYQKIGLQSIVDFTVEETHCYMAGGVIHHNSGKSDAGAYIGSYLARFGHPNTNSSGHIRDRSTSGWVVSLDYRASQEVIQPKYFDNGFVAPGSHPPFIPDREIDDWRVADQVLKLKNGSLIGFKSAESPRTKFQGAEKDWIHFDEEPPKGHFEESIIRVGKRPLTVFSTCTLLPPEGTSGGITWVFPEIIKPYLNGQMEDIHLFGASIYDNPHVDRETIKLLEAIYPQGSTQRRIRLDGEWLAGLSGARCYSSFSSKLIKPQKDFYSPSMPLAWYFDFNVSPFISGVGQRQGDMFRCMNEFVMEEGNHEDMVDLFVREYGNHFGEIWIYGDATGERRSSQTGKTDYAIIINALNRHKIYPKLKIPTVNPNPNDRINAVNRAFKDETGEHKFEIDPCCVELIDDFEQVLRDKRGGIKKSHNPKEPYYRRTHASDAVGYWISMEAPVIIRKIKNRKFVNEIKRPYYGFSM